MHVTASLAGQDAVDVEVGEGCRSLQALKEAIVRALPQLCVEDFDVCVGGRALDDDEGVVSLVDSVTLDLVANTRGLSALALRRAGREVSEAGLLAAARAGESSKVKLYLDAEIAIDCAESDGKTPLHLACRHADKLLPELLLERGSRAINGKTKDGETPLHIACSGGHSEVAELLLTRGSCANERTSDGRTPLHIACDNGHETLAKKLLAKDVSAITEKTDAGWTPLHCACSRADVSLAKLLLDQGSLINEPTKAGWTPLHFACSGRHLALARLLLSRGSSATEMTGGDLRTPLHIACDNGHGELAKNLLDNDRRAIDVPNGSGNTPLHISCLNGHLSLTTLLLDCGSRSIDDGARTEGWTPLHLACYNGHVSVTKLLLQRGSRAINKQNKDGATPLELACTRGDQSVASLLLDKLALLSDAASVAAAAAAVAVAVAASPPLPSPPPVAPSPPVRAASPPATTRPTSVGVVVSAHLYGTVATVATVVDTAWGGPALSAHLSGCLIDEARKRSHPSLEHVAASIWNASVVTKLVQRHDPGVPGWVDLLSPGQLHEGSNLFVQLTTLKEQPQEGDLVTLAPGHAPELLTTGCLKHGDVGEVVCPPGQTVAVESAAALTIRGPRGDVFVYFKDDVMVLSEHGGEEGGLRRELDVLLAKKVAAVALEDFAEAKVLKEKIDMLRDALEKLRAQQAAAAAAAAAADRGFVKVPQERKEAAIAREDYAEAKAPRRAGKGAKDQLDGQNRVAAQAAARNGSEEALLEDRLRKG